MDGLVRKMGIGVGWDVDDSGLVEANQATDGLVDTTEDAESAVDGLSSAGQDAGSKLSRSFDGFKDSIGRGLGALEDMKFKLGAVAAAGSAAIFKMVGMAGDMEERLNTLNREFGASARQVEDFARRYSRATELTENQLIDWSATLGINFRMLDLTADQTADLTQEMIELTHNYAHFMDMEPEAAFSSIHQAIRGGRFPRALRDLTGQVRQTDIEQRALSEGLIQQGEEMDSQAERIATLSLLQEELALTQGAATAGQLEWNTRMANFRGVLGDISRDLGHMFLPSIGRALAGVTEFLYELRESRLLRLAGGFLGLTTAVAGLAAGIGFATFLFGKLKAAAAAAGTTVLGLIAPFLLKGLLVAGLVLAIEDLWVALQGGDSVIGNLIGWLGDTLGITEELKEGWQGFTDGMSEIWSSIRRIGSGIASVFIGLGQIIWGFLTFDTDMMLEGFSNLWEGIKDIFWGIPELFWNIGGNLNDALQWLFWTALTGLWSLVTRLGANIWDSATWLVEQVWDGIRSKIAEWTGIELPEIKLPRWADVRKFVSEKWNEFTDWFHGLKEQYWPEIRIPTWSDITAFAQRQWSRFTDWLGSLKDRYWPSINIPSWDDITALAQEEWQQFTGWFGSLVDRYWPDINLPTISDIRAAVSGMWDRFTGWFGGLVDRYWPSIELPEWDDITQAAQNVWDSFIGWFADLKDRMWPNISLPSIGDIRETASEKWSRFTGWFGELKDRAWPDISLPTITDIKEAVSKRWNELTTWLGNLKPVQVLRDAFAGFTEWRPELPEISFSLTDIVQTVADFKPVKWLRERFEGFKEWRPALPSIQFSLSDIVNAIADFAPVKWLRDRFEGFSDWLPSMPNINITLSDIVNTIADFGPVAWLRERFAGFRDWKPSLPSIEFSLSDIVDAIIDWSPRDWLSIAFAGFSAWIPEKPDIDIRLSNLVDAINDWWPIRWLRDAFAGFAEWRPSLPEIEFSLDGIVDAVLDFKPVEWLREGFKGFAEWTPSFPDITGMIGDWWDGVRDWVDDNLSFGGLIEGAVDVAGGISDTVGGWFGGDDDPDEGEVAVAGGKHIEHKGDRITDNRTFNMTFNIEERDDAEEVARKVKSELKRFLKQEAAEAGAN